MRPAVASRKRRVVVGVSAVMVVVLAAVLYAVFKPGIDGPPPDVPEPVIAVFPFENLGSPEDQYFADGMTEEITSRLASIKGLGVISRTSSVKLSESDKTLREIGREHGVDFVLEGSVRWSKVGDQYKVRITPQLIRVSDDRHMWADNYERALIEVFAVQADIAEKIVEQLGLTLVDKDRQNLASRPTENPEAYRYYLKALKAIREASDYSGSITAQAATDSAVAFDPAFALAHALRSEAHSNGAWNAPESKRGKLALESARRSLELQPGLPQGYLALGNYYHRVEGDDNRALEEFAKAKVELRNDPELLEAIAYVQSRQGKYEEALENRRMAAGLDPLNARRQMKLSDALQDVRRFAEAEEAIDRAIALEPEDQTYYEDKIDCVIARYGDIERVKLVVSTALLYCDTTKFIIRNSSVTRYIPELSTDSVIAHYVRIRRADKSNDHFFGDLPFWYFQHMDILEGYEAEARVLVGRYDGSDKFLEWYALLFSFLGECDKAIELGLRYRVTEGECVSCIPYSYMRMARVYSNCGLYEEAIDELDAVLSLETYVTVNTLKFKHWIDPFRDDPRFLALTRMYQ